MRILAETKQHAVTFLPMSKEDAQELQTISQISQKSKSVKATISQSVEDPWPLLRIEEE